MFFTLLREGIYILSYSGAAEYVPAVLPAILCKIAPYRQQQTANIHGVAADCQNILRSQIEESCTLASRQLRVETLKTYLLPCTTYV